MTFAICHGPFNANCNRLSLPITTLLTIKTLIRLPQWVGQEKASKNDPWHLPLELEPKIASPSLWWELSITMWTGKFLTPSKSLRLLNSEGRWKHGFANNLQFNVIVAWKTEFRQFRLSQLSPTNVVGQTFMVFFGWSVRLLQILSTTCCLWLPGIVLNNNNVPGDPDVEQIQISMMTWARKNKLWWYPQQQ